MATSIQDVYRAYLGMECSLKGFHDWLALNQWELSGIEEDMADEADAAIARLDDGHLTEENLRDWLAAVLEKYTVGTTRLDSPVTHAKTDILIPAHPRTSTVAPEGLVGAMA